jgi:Putative bacterial sensory transduction regulator
MKIQKMYFDYLLEQGFAPKVDKEGDVVFKFEGKTFYISIHEKDEQYFRLIMPNFWSIDHEAEMIKALRVCNDINTELKVGKVSIIRDNVMATAEMFIEENPILDQFFMRTLNVVKTAADRFSKAMLEEVVRGYQLN